MNNPSRVAQCWRKNQMDWTLEKLRSEAFAYAFTYVN
jgi:hypothetical protein